jgi:hypothetical protein
MKKIVLITLFLTLLQPVSGRDKTQIEKPIVDKRVELVSIVFRLSGNREYSNNILQGYTKDIDQYFSRFADHELINFAKLLNKTKSISYDAPVSVAITLDKNLNPVIKYTDSTFARWSSEDAGRFVRLLKKFSKDTKSERFFKEHSDIYRTIEAGFSDVYKNLDISWFGAFFGVESKEKFNVVIAPGIGVNNYGPSFINAKGKKEVFAVMGVWQADSLGLPFFNNQRYLATLVHEFCHSFVNELNKKSLGLFKTNLDIIAHAMKEEMGRQAYNSSETILNEALVRAAVIKYFKDHNASKDEVEQMLKFEYNLGFLWIRELVEELEKYDSSRYKYLSLESYMPHLARAYSNFAAKVEIFESKRPRIISIKEFNNGEVAVSPLLKRITIEFDRPLAGNGFSINLGSKGKDAFPVVKNIFYSDDKSSVVMEVDLEPSKEYQFILTGSQFKTVEGYPLKREEINFKTISL